MKHRFLLKKQPGGLKALLAKDYELLHRGSIWGALSFHDWQHSELSIGPNQYIISSEAKDQWSLTQRGKKVAGCKRSVSGSKIEFAIEFDDRVWRFRPHRKRLVLTHEIFEDEVEIGQIFPIIRLWWWSEIEATFSELPRLEIASFAIWIIGIHWVGIAGQLTAARAQRGI